MKQNSCVVVTGANGLAGSAVVEHLRRPNGYTCVIPMTRADADLMDLKATREFFDRVKPDYVFHSAACVFGLGGNLANQARSFLENTLINTHVIDAAYKSGAKKIVAMGTNAAYPATAALPYREAELFEGRPHHGEYGYGLAKRHMLAMFEAYDKPYCYLVSGNLYGERDTFDPVNGHVLPALIHKFWEAAQTDYDTVNIWGDGQTKRDFLHSHDLARIAEIALNDDEAIGAINTGYGVAYTVEYIAKRLSGISGVGYDRVRYDTSKPKGRPATYSDLSKLHGLGFSPEVHIGDGLQRTYEWYSKSRAPR